MTDGSPTIFTDLWKVLVEQFFGLGHRTMLGGQLWFLLIHFPSTLRMQPVLPSHWHSSTGTLQWICDQGMVILRPKAPYHGILFQRRQIRQRIAKRRAGLMNQNCVAVGFDEGISPVVDVQKYDRRIL